MKYLVFDILKIWSWPNIYSYKSQHCSIEPQTNLLSRYGKLWISSRRVFCFPSSRGGFRLFHLILGGQPERMLLCSQLFTFSSYLFLISLLAAASSPSASFSKLPFHTWRTWGLFGWWFRGSVLNWFKLMSYSSANARFTSSLLILIPSGLCLIWLLRSSFVVFIFRKDK